MEAAATMLEVPLNASPAVLKRAYYKKALVTHPDKNKDPNADEQFRQLQEAYATLRERRQAMEKEKEQEESWFDSTAMLDALANAVSEDTLLTMYKFLMEYKELIPEHEFIIDLIKSKLTRPHVAVEPTLQNLFEQKVFIYTHENGKKYSIPLWHHTLFFDDLIVICNPKTGSADTWIDDANNIHTMVRASVSNLLIEGKLAFNIGHKHINIAASELGVAPMQTHVLKSQGVPWPDTDDMLDVARLSDIFVHVHLTT